MPRYFFHVHLGQAVGLDAVGLELADLCQAIASAHRAIVEIMNEDAIGQLWLEIATKRAHTRENCVATKSSGRLWNSVAWTTGHAHAEPSSSTCVFKGYQPTGE